MYALLLGLHPFSHGAALIPVSFVAPCLYLLGDAFEDIPVPMPFLDLVLYLLISDADEVLHLPVVSVV